MSEHAETSTKTSGTTDATASDPTTLNNGDSIKRYANRLNKYKAGQSPTTLYPSQSRSFNPGLSWLGDDEFESTGLAFKLRRMAVSKPSPGPNKNANWNANPKSGPQRNDRKLQTRTRASDNAGKNATRSKNDLTRNPRSRQAPKTVESDFSTGQATSHPTLKPSPAPLRVDLKSADFTSLFGASPSLSTSPSSTSTKSTTTDNASSRVQLALEQYGGDYSNLVSGSLVTSQGSPIVYAKSTMGRRRDLGLDKRNTALGIIRGMVNKSEDSRPTA